VLKDDFVLQYLETVNDSTGSLSLFGLGIVWYYVTPIYVIGNRRMCCGS